MSRFLFIPLSVAAVAVLAACGNRQPNPVVVVPPSTPVVTVPQGAAATESGINRNLLIEVS